MGVATSHENLICKKQAADQGRPEYPRGCLWYSRQEMSTKETGQEGGRQNDPENARNAVLTLLSYRQEHVIKTH